MTKMDRRQFLATGLFAGTAIATPDMVLAGASPPGWALGVADVEADIAEQMLTLIGGRAPEGLNTTLYRNGPAKFRRGNNASGHWFDGDGLVRKFRIADGQATLAARFVDTPKRQLETRLDAIVQPGFGTAAGSGAVVTGPDDCNPANTSVMLAGDELLALWEAGSPAIMDRESLETKGFKTYRRDLKHMPFLAHPRVEPDGTIWNLGGTGRGTFLWKLRRDGSLDQAQLLPMDRNSYFHDFTATSRHLIIVLQPWVQDSLKFPLATSMSWKPELGTRIVVIEKDDLTKRRIFELPAFSFFHLADGWEEGDGTIRFDGCLEADPSFGQRAASALLRGEYVRSPSPLLTQIVLRPDGKAEMQTTRISGEFPAIDKRMAGFARRFTIHVTGYREGPFPHCIAIWDWNRGRDDRFDFGDHRLVEEFLFHPKGEGERNGWLIGTTLNLKTRKTELHVLDARHVSSGPVASWEASLPLPLTFHGTLG